MVYGELYGKFFQHPDGHILNGGKDAVQRGICYSPNLEFIAFDVVVEGRFLPFLEAQSLCRRLGLDHVDAIFTGTKQEVHEFVLRTVDTFKTTRQRPGASGEYLNPVAEGYVWRHMTEHVLNKHRSKNYQETIHYGPKSRKSYQSDKTVDVTDYCTEQRLNNLKSKRVDQLTKETIKEWAEAMIDDIQQEMTKDGWVYVPEKMNKLVSRFLWRQAH